MASNSSGGRTEGGNPECIRSRLRNVSNPNKLKCFHCHYTWLNFEPSDIVMYAYKSKILCYLCGPREEAKDMAILDAKDKRQHITQSNYGMSCQRIEDPSNWLKIRRTISKFSCNICHGKEGNEPLALAM